MGAVLKHCRVPSLKLGEDSGVTRSVSQGYTTRLNRRLTRLVMYQVRFFIDKIFLASRIVKTNSRFPGNPHDSPHILVIMLWSTAGTVRGLWTGLGALLPGPRVDASSRHGHYHVGVEGEIGANAVSDGQVRRRKG